MVFFFFSFFFFLALHFQWWFSAFSLQILFHSSLCIGRSGFTEEPVKWLSKAGQVRARPTVKKVSDAQWFISWFRPTKAMAEDGGFGKESHWSSCATCACSFVFLRGILYNKSSFFYSLQHCIYIHVFHLNSKGWPRSGSRLHASVHPIRTRLA
jgi:hypothetical protein